MPVLFCLIIWVIRPEHVQLLFTNPTGKKLIMLAIMLEVTGFLVMFRMARVKA
jgi:Flp pilus assembly protein TadB